ncbi:uncharacterized protein LOC142233623 [Haematobia irritans]|uniref:uncharacterized protein LOC142233623 n=1 Tax=Haematobia irritans TaxID=7368 RepID=UPI003F4F8840
MVSEVKILLNSDRMPPPLDGSNLALQWPGWKRHFLIYMTGKKLLKEAENVKIAQLLMICDRHIIDIYNALYPNDGSIDELLGVSGGGEASKPGRKLDEVLSHFDEYFTPKRNISMEAFKFNCIVQKEHQPFSKFETELRKQIQHCDFKCVCGASYESRMLRDRIIIGVFDKNLQLQLLNGKDETLETVIEKCKIIESANTNKIDTGSDVNCIPLKFIEKSNIELNNENNNYPVFDYSRSKIDIVDTVELECVDLDTGFGRTAEFLVVNNTYEPLLGLQTCMDFGLVKRMDVRIVDQYPSTKEDLISRNRDVFDGLGKFPKPFSITLKEDAVPSIHYRKRFPLCLLDRLKSEIGNMVEAGIIAPVNYPTQWVSNIQVVEKRDGSLRICLDPKKLNEQIQREHFLIPTVDDFTSRLIDMKVFTVLDLSRGFWHMQLDEKSSDLTTFMTHL